ncbi:ATP-dependent nuclease [Pseudomonas soli]|uniref:ATP-dependent nuclease n=1 Tax=Pseudomonas soli TaxID=1306993 RepID=UPI0015E8DCAC|nr:AAA family ATPase [Pseudomonas soli]
MKLESLRIKNFRTITTEQLLTCAGGLTLVGPNNAGKTNALMALYMFFTGYENRHGYNPSTDLSFSDKFVKTSLTCHFTGEPEGSDADAFDKLQRLRSYLGISDPQDGFSINVYFNGANPVYQVYPGVKRPEGKASQYSTLQKSFIQLVLDSFQCYYIPSKKSIDELYSKFVSPFIKLKVGQALTEHLPRIRESVAAVADSMNSVLSVNGLDKITVGFDIPNGAMNELVSGFDLHVSDPDTSSIYSKGMGVQAAVLLSSFKWITQQQNDKHVIWLIEEPETYMHPSLAFQSSKILDDLSSISTVVKTTHAINFVPTDISVVQGVTRQGKSQSTWIRQFSNHRDATQSIRESLGVKFSDYFALGRFTLFVEGETDKLYIEHVWESMLIFQKAEYPYMMAHDFLVKDFTGVPDLLGFLKANFGLLNSEICLVSLFDGDKAGVDASKGMAQFCSNKDYDFNANREYVLLPNGREIEGLFPDEWIMEAYVHEKAWFEISPVVDAEENLVSFKIRDASKKAFAKFMLDRFDEDHTYDSAEGFFKLFKVINRAMEIQAQNKGL